MRKRRKFPMWESQVGRTIQMAARYLPEFAEIQIRVENGAATTALYVDGEEMAVGEGETLVDEMVDLIRQARAIEKGS